jgi:hypothetical protein
VSSILFPLLATALAASPIPEPVAETARPVATASATIVATVRPDWPGTPAGTMLKPSSQSQQGRRIARRTGPRGEPWYDLEFQ